MTRWQGIDTAPKDGTPIRIRGRRFKTETRYRALAAWTTRNCPDPITGWFPATDKHDGHDGHGPFLAVTDWVPIEANTGRET